MPTRGKARVAAAVGYLTLAAVDTYLAGRPGGSGRRTRRVTKPLLMPVLAVHTELARPPALPAARLTRSVQAAQLFSWGGDVALLGGGRRSFLGGVGSFLVAHLCYIGGFAGERDATAGVSSPGAKAGVVTWAVTAPVMAMAAGRQDPTLRTPVAAYAAVLSAMFATSTMLRRSMPAGTRRRIVAGSSLFLLSDSLLGIQKFLRTQPSPTLESAVMVTYTAGQWLIADGVVRADAHT